MKRVTRNFLFCLAFHRYTKSFNWSSIKQSGSTDNFRRVININYCGIMEIKMPSQFSFCLLLFIVLKSKDFWQVKAQKNCSEAPTKTLQMACKMLHAFDEKSRVKWTFLLFNIFNSKHFCLLLNVILWTFFIIKNLIWKGLCANKLCTNSSDKCYKCAFSYGDPNRLFSWDPFRIVDACVSVTWNFESFNDHFTML